MEYPIQSPTPTRTTRAEMAAVKRTTTPLNGVANLPPLTWDINRGVDPHTNLSQISLPLTSPGRKRPLPSPSRSTRKPVLEVPPVISHNVPSPHGARHQPLPAMPTPDAKDQGVHSLLASLTHIATSVAQLQQGGVDKCEARKQLKQTILNLQQQATILRRQAAMEANGSGSDHLRAIDDMLASLATTFVTMEGNIGAAEGSPMSVGNRDMAWGMGQFGGSCVTSGVTSSSVTVSAPGDSKLVVDVPQPSWAVQRSMSKRKWQGMEPSPLSIHTRPRIQSSHPSRPDLFSSMLTATDSPSATMMPDRVNSMTGTTQSILDSWLPLSADYSDVPSRTGAFTTASPTSQSPSTPVTCAAGQQEGGLMTKQSSSATEELAPWRQHGNAALEGFLGRKGPKLASPTASSNSVELSVSFRLNYLHSKPGLNDQEVESPGRAVPTLGFPDLSPTTADHDDLAMRLLDGSGLPLASPRVLPHVDGLSRTLDSLPKVFGDNAKERAMRVAAQLATSGPGACASQLWVSDLPSPRADEGVDWENAWPSEAKASGKKRSSNDFRGFHNSGSCLHSSDLVQTNHCSNAPITMPTAFQIQVTEMNRPNAQTTLSSAWPLQMTGEVKRPEVPVPVPQLVVRDGDPINQLPKREVDVPKEVLSGLGWD